MSTIFHFTSEDDWRAAQESGVYLLSTRETTLEEEGFIHCSEAHQVGRIADAVYADSDEPLVVLTIATDRLDAHVRYENLEGGTELFPHIYGPLPIDAVTSVMPLRRDPGGNYVFPEQDVEGCMACDLSAGRRPLPGGPIDETDLWRVEHTIGPLGLGTLIVKPKRHLVHVAGLTNDEAAELGPLLRRTAALVTELVDPEQVYVTLWSHAGAVPGHIHWVVQPVTRADMDGFDDFGPSLQVKMFERGRVPDPTEIEAFAERAAKLLAEQS